MDRIAPSVQALVADYHNKIDNAAAERVAGDQN